MAGSVCWSCIIEVELAKDLSHIYQHHGLTQYNLQVRVFNNARELKIYHHGDAAGEPPCPENCRLDRHRCDACLNVESDDTRGDSGGADPDAGGSHEPESRISG